MLLRKGGYHQGSASLSKIRFQIIPGSQVISLVCFPLFPDSQVNRMSRFLICPGSWAITYFLQETRKTIYETRSLLQRIA